MSAKMIDGIIYGKDDGTLPDRLINVFDGNAKKSGFTEDGFPSVDFEKPLPESDVKEILGKHKLYSGAMLSSGDKNGVQIRLMVGPRMK